MARTVQANAHAARRNAILAVARRLVETKGYEQMTIQDILDELQCSKGAFYHYFDSKRALLEALIERMQDEVQQLLTPMVQDGQLSALAKLQSFFAMTSRWKSAQKAYLLGFLRAWQVDANALVRERVRATAFQRLAPLLAEIVRQGMREGVLCTAFPDQAGEVALALIQGLGEALTAWLLSSEPPGDSLPRIERTVAAYTEALERVLGAPVGTLCLLDGEGLETWATRPLPRVANG